MFIEEYNENTIRLIDSPNLKEFLKICPNTLSSLFKKFKKIDLDYAFGISSTFSSQIEGNPLDINSYMRIKNSDDLELKKDKSYLEIEDLKKAYEYAKENLLNENNFLKSHGILSQDLKISKTEKGKYRIGENEAIYGEEGLRYVAIETKYVINIMKEFFEDISVLLNKELTIEEILYYSIFIHLMFLNIHPFRDGNGRSARLLQKWFLKEKLGEMMWKLPFENYIYKNKENYYRSLEIGINFYEIDYNDSLNFFKLFLNSLV
jgi:Fic family protein